MSSMIDDADLAEPVRRSRWSAWSRLALEYAFWFGAAILLKLALSAWTSVPYPSPFWIPVVVLALQRGLAAGLSAALIAAALQLLPGLPAPSLAEDIYAYIGRIAFEPVAWTAVALCFGQLRSREIRTLAAVRERLLERTRHTDAVAELCTHLRQRIETLERHIAANEDASVCEVAEAIIKLEQAGWDDFTACLRQVVLVMTGAAEFTVYLLAENGLEAAVLPEGERPGVVHAPIKPATALYNSIVSERQVISAATPGGAALLGSVGIFAGPLLEAHASGRVVGMLALSGASADALPEDIERRFTLACSELSRSVERIKLINTWRAARNGQLRETDEIAMSPEADEKGTPSLMPPEQRPSLQ